MEGHQTPQSSDHIARPAPIMASRSVSSDQRTRSEDSWIDIASQPSSSSLSSAADEVITTGLRVQQDPRRRRRRSTRQSRPTHLNISHRPHSTGATSSQEEYEESESESDRVLTSSGEGPFPPSGLFSRPNVAPAPPPPTSEDNIPDDDNRTAINYPINNEQCFTPQPNAFSHPPSGQLRHASQPVAGSYFPAQRPAPRPSPRHSLPAPQDLSHMPHNILSPSYNAAAQHEEALRSSLTTLLSCAAAARGLPKAEKKEQTTTTHQEQLQPRSKPRPTSFRLIPASQLPSVTSPPQLQEPTFKPTIRRDSTSTSTSFEQDLKENKRKARNSSRERRSLKKARRSSSSEDLQVSPTLLTWLVSAGVVVAISALSFSAGYSLGKEAGRIEAGDFGANEQVRSCAREAGRSGLGLKRSLARSAVQV